MNSSDEIKLRIARQAFPLYVQFGFRKVTMDEVAAACTMSKKTIYQYYPGKKELIRSCMQLIMSEIASTVSTVVEDKMRSFDDKARNLLFILAERNRLLSKPLVADLQRETPDIWREMVEIRQRNIERYFSRVLEQGIEEGYIRSDIPMDIVIIALIQMIQGIVTSENLQRMPYSAQQLVNMIFKIIFQGILIHPINLQGGQSCV